MGSCLKPMSEVKTPEMTIKGNDTNCCDDNTASTSCLCCIHVTISKEKVSNALKPSG